MKNTLFKLLVAVAVLASASCAKSAGDHPSLILTKSGVEQIRQQLGSVPLLDETVAATAALVDAEIALGIDTPVPVHFSGGYTHKRHKQNFLVAEKAGMLFQILGDEKYAQYVRDMLMQYEALYKTLPVHPQKRSYAPGKLFWQCLNDSNWLVYMSQAYDAIYDWLPANERELLENNLFRPFADYISVGNPQFYNRIHNHSTWGNAAVGMIGLVMNHKELIDRALYGLSDDGLAFGMKDDDGGLIKVEGQKAGFLANLEEPFSPSGYYTEGPYYQRYAMYPFLIFALAMHNAQPEMGVLEHSDGVLLKAIDALLNLSDADGDFFALNDAQKGMSYYTRELVSAVNISYHYGDRNPGLLSIAQQQGQVLLGDAGLTVAEDIAAGMAEPFTKRSVNLTDGANGDQGGVAVLRARGEALASVFKYTAQGLSHGHYDKLSFSLFEEGDEVLQDYGLVRFVNIEQKGGGNYLPENGSWAKQTIAHNTITQNQISHFGGDYATGSKHHSELHLYDASRADVQVVSAKESNAYPGTLLHRTQVMVAIETLEKPLLLDIFKITSEQQNQYDLPFYFNGQLLETNFAHQQPAQLEPLGDSHGYQHLYTEGEGAPAGDNIAITWLNEGKFYTLTAAAKAADELLFARIGANDPNFNLRRDAAFMQRRSNEQNTLFATVIEPHGNYSPVTEKSHNPRGRVSNVEVINDDENYTAVAFDIADSGQHLFILANQNTQLSDQHSLEIDGQIYQWQGGYFFDLR
ncbi:heparinase II/III family protein, partial [Porticoccaceae bacterium]|nr:heparinase II/III family protein [Porticoccaceae bacterium]